MREVRSAYRKWRNGGMGMKKSKKDAASIEEKDLAVTDTVQEKEGKSKKVKK